MLLDPGLRRDDGKFFLAGWRSYTPHPFTEHPYVEAALAATPRCGFLSRLKALLHPSFPYRTPYVGAALAAILRHKKTRSP
jgi:hypothetical protein